MPEQFKRPVLSWLSDEGGGFIHLDAVPQMENTLAAKITEFPLEQGAVVSDHIIQQPDRLKIMIAQTNTPFEDSEDGVDLPFERVSIPLEAPKTRFEPKGLLAGMLLAESAVGAAVDAIGGLFGVGGGETPAQISVYKPPYEDKDRINDLYDQLVEAKLRGYEMSLEWLGRLWSGYYIESIVYSRKKLRQMGDFTVALKHVQIVATGVTDLPSPAEARLEASVNGGNHPGTLTDPADREAAGAAAEESVLSSLTPF